MPETETDPKKTLRQMLGSGEMAELIQAFDWSTTPLGPASAWPVSLRTAVSMVVRSPAPMVLLWGEDGVMIYNHGYAVIAGARHPSALGSKVRLTWPEVAAFNSHVIDVVLKGESLTYRDQELSLERNGRAERTWFTLDYSPVIGESGVPLGVIAVVVETTEKVQAERWLRAERERLRQMFEQSPGFMAMLRGPEHVFDLVNPAYLQLVGHRAILGQTVREALPDIEGQGFFELLDNVFNTGEAFTGHAVRVSFRRTPEAPEETRFVDFVFQPVNDPSGQVLGIFVQGTDITDRIAAERSVQLSETRNRQILDSAIDYAIIAFDPAGKVTRWNEGAHRVLGWTEAEMLGHDASRIFTPEDRAAHRMEEEMREALGEGAGSDERWHLRKSGERFWASGEMTPIRDDAGAAIGFVKVLRDRTEQHQAAQALRQSEESLRRAQSAGGVGTFSLALDRNVVSGTSEFFRIFGLTETDEVPAETIEALVLPEDAHVRSGVSTRDTQLAPLDVEYRIRRADDGAVRWIARKAEWERDADGRVRKMLGAVQDITARKADQRAIEQSAAQFETFAQTLPNHVWTSPPDGQLDWFNDRIYAYSGGSRSQLNGEGWTAIVHPDDVAEAAARWSRSLATGELYETEFRLRRADGEYRWHLARAVPIRTSDGVITRWVGTNTDIHERKLAEAESTRDRDRIWTSINDLMATMDRDATLRSTNPAWKRLLGYDEAALMAHRLVDFVDADDRERLCAALATLERGEPATAFELRLLHQDGRRFLVAWTAEHVGDFLYLVGRDVTEQRAVENALRQSQKMEAVGQLTGGIAHDFNNLLQGITGSLNLVQKRIAQGKPQEIERFIDGAMSSAKRAAALTHRLLAFSRRQPLDPKPVDANPLVASMEDLLHRTLGERIHLQMVLAGNLLRTRCDPNQLESAILNLAINSRDAMPDGGTLTIETANVMLDAAASAQQGIQPGRYVCISVSDTGAGMSADTIAKAFEPFFTTKPMGQGTGLGLSMIYGFARQSDGYAKIYSELGRGTSVKLHLPAYRGADEPEVPLPELSPEHAAGAGETVLVVEDEALVRALIIEVLGDLGYAVIEAADGPAGLERLQSGERIDLLITDIGLPGLNGRQIAEAGRLLRPALKVLFMTGYAENAAMAAGFLEPGMAMITKPFAMEGLATKVREVIGEEPAPPRPRHAGKGDAAAGG